MDIWKLAYHLSGVTLLGRNGPEDLEPLAPLPMPVRNAVLRMAKRLDPDAITLEEITSELNFIDGTYQWIANWSVKDERLARRIQALTLFAPLEFQSVDEYFSTYNLHPNGKNDEHYAERRFIEEIVVPKWGLGILSHLTPQVHFGNKGQRIDFVIEGEQHYALEIEGFTFHNTCLSNKSEDANLRQRFISEKARQAELAIRHYLYFPIPFDDIKSGIAGERLNELLADDVLAQLVNMSTEAQTDSHSSAHIVESLLKTFVQRYQFYQTLVLSILCDAVAKNQETITIGDFQPRYPLFAIALHDTLLLLEKVASLYALPLQLPNIEFYSVGEVGEHYHSLVRFYLLSAPLCKGNPVDKPCKLTFNTIAADDVPHFTLYSQAERHRHHQISNAYAYEELKQNVHQFRAVIGHKLPVESQVVAIERAVLDYFARRYFRVPELKYEQFDLLQRVLREQSTIGILPTGFGKSLIFQLYAVLVPRTTIVISPLKSLMRDQLYNLHQLGFKCVEAISSDDKTTQKDAKLKAFLNHKHRLLYISPERLQINGFQKALLFGAASVPMGALVIDEAHCVSEWGHDFRPAYLQLARYRHLLEQKLKRTVVTLGLTATASTVVEKDILALLHLSDDAIVRTTSSDRPNLSFSVHTVTDDVLAKSQELQTALKEQIPQALHLESWQELLPVGEGPPYHHAGIIFGIYADPRGKTTIEEGVPAIAHRVVETLVHDPSLVQVHASTPTTRCPECHSIFYVWATADGGGYHCTVCQAKFPVNHAYVEPDWDQKIIARQNAFQANQFPLLVATKGFGMGIDKRNIRYVIHHALAGSMEGYFQEAGRAGRDGKHAHIALIYSPPTDSCYAKHLSKNQAPPCVTDQANFKFYKCDYGLKKLCDAGRQARFIAQNYPGQSTDKEELLGTLQELIKFKGKLYCTNDNTVDEPARQLQIQLYRLQLLGIVKNYSLNYKGQRVHFDVEPGKHDVDTLVVHLKKFLRKLNSSKQIINAALARLDTANPVDVAVDILLERIYAEIPKMRYTMLGNLLRYTKSNERDICRRVEIRSTFDGDDLPLEGYRCGFCDVCQPDLDFQVDQADLLQGDEEVNDISRNLSDELRRFDANRLITLVELADAKGAVPGLYAKVSRLLEREPTHVPALYFAGALGLRQKHFAELGFEQLKFCYREAVRQGYEADILKNIYHAAKAADAVEAFRWIDEVDGPFDDEAQFAFLQEEAISIWGESSIQVNNLKTLQKIRKFHSLENGVAILASAIHTLAKQ